MARLSIITALALGVASSCAVSGPDDDHAGIGGAKVEGAAAFVPMVDDHGGEQALGPIRVLAVRKERCQCERGGDEVGIAIGGCLVAGLAVAPGVAKAVAGPQVIKDGGEGVAWRPWPNPARPKTSAASARAAIIRPFQSARTLSSKPGGTRCAAYGEKGDRARGQAGFLGIGMQAMSGPSD